MRSLVPLLVFAAGIPMAAVLPNWAGGLWFALIWPLSLMARRIVLGNQAAKDD